MKRGECVISCFEALSSKYNKDNSYGGQLALMAVFVNVLLHLPCCCVTVCIETFIVVSKLYVKALA